MTASPDALARAENLIELGRKTDAEALVRAELIDDPENARALRLLAQALLGSSRTGECHTAARRAVAADPDSEHGHRLLAITAAEAGFGGEAERAAREAVRLAPNTWQTHYTLGSVLRRGGWTRKKDALSSALQALELAPHVSTTHTLVGMCYANLDLTDSATAAYLEAIRLNPNDAMALNNLAAIQMNNGSLSKASATLRSGLSASPQEAILRLNYDVVLLKLMRRLYVALYVVFLVQMQLATSKAPYPARIGVGLALVALCAAASAQVTRNLPRGAHLWARGLFGRATQGQRVLIARFILVLAVDIATAISPATVALGIGTAGFFAFVVLLIAALALRDRGPRDHSPPDRANWRT
ncbi:MAG: Tetratricopeptide repeat protein [Marmoricola sp.]|nr:Tetratricopeptide repeat protein [Marmoricola sp.]